MKMIDAKLAMHKFIEKHMSMLPGDSKFPIAIPVNKHRKQAQKDNTKNDIKAPSQAKDTEQHARTALDTLMRAQAERNRHSQHA